MGNAGYPDLHEHIAALERHGLLVRVNRPINKDTEMHPLVRWQFRGGIPESERKAFLFDQRHRQQGPQLRHSGRRRHPRLQPGNLRRRHRLRGRGHPAAMGSRRAASDRRRCWSTMRAVPGDRDPGRRSSTSPARASTRCRSRSRRRASTTRPMRPARCSSPRIPTPGSRTSATTAPW